MEEVQNGKGYIGFAFRQSVPVMLGYIFLGIAFGLLLQDAGYSFVWAFFISVIVYAGSMQFIMVSLMTGGAGLLYTAVMTFFINGRHIFYGLSFVEKYKKMGKACPYMVFSLTDETYSVLCGTKVPEGMKEDKVFFWISLFDHSYWVAGSVLGAVAGSYITIDTTGIDFSMTALFLVIMDFMAISHFAPSLAAGILVVGLHVWKKNILLSIGAGTVCYMMLVQMVFV